MAKRLVNGVLFLNKPEGLSSQQALNKVRFLFAAKKAGHGGTLDPFASGMLPILFGEASKFAKYFLQGEKSYQVRLKFGKRTTTDDKTGEVIESANIPLPKMRDWTRIFSEFQGKIWQKPPIYSALKIKGARAYDLARRGLLEELPAREVEIYDLRLLKEGDDFSDLFVRCAKGTYIRALVRDIAFSLGSVGFAEELHRKTVGNYQIMHDLSTIETLSLNARDALLLPLHAVVEDLPRIDVREDKFSYIRNGNDIYQEELPDIKEAALFYHNHFFGIAEVRNSRIYPKRLCAIDL